MTNHFEKHNVMHVSPSLLNLWISQPAMAMLRIAGFKDNEAGPAAWRGQGVDKAAARAAFYPTTTEDSLVELALDIFSEHQNNATSDHDEKKLHTERSNISDMTRNAAKFYRGIGETPVASQGKVTAKLEDIPVPMLGYFDLLYDDTVRDTKTVGRMTSKLSAAHARQCAFYAVATKVNNSFIDYVGKKEVKSFRVNNIDYWNRQNILAAKSLERVLSFSDDIFECCQLVFPDFDHWMWNETTRDAARTVWNME